MVEYEKLKYEVEIDTSSLGPQLALAQTQIGAALSDQVGVGMAAQLPRPAGGIGLGDVVYGLGAEGNLAYQKAALFSQTAISHTAGIQAMPAPIIIQSPIQQQFIPQQAPYSPAQMPGMGAIGFQPDVQVGPMAMLVHPGFATSAPWATAAQEAKAVSMAWGDFGMGAMGVGADLGAFGVGGTAGYAMAKLLKMGTLTGGALSLGVGFLASHVVGSGFEAVQDEKNWGRMYSNYNVSISDATDMAREIQGYGTSTLGIFGRGMLEGVDFTGLLQMERASRVASKYGLKSRSAREDPSYILQAGAIGLAKGIIDPVYGGIEAQAVDMGQALDVVQTSMKVDQETAGRIASQMVKRGASLKALSALRNIDIYDPILDAYTDPSTGGRAGAMAQIAMDLTSLGGAPLARTEGFTPGGFAAGIIASRMTVSDLFNRGTFGDAQQLRGFGVTPNTILSDLHTLGAAGAQSPLNMAVSTAILGGYEGPMDADSIYKRMAGLIEKGNMADHVSKGALDVSRGGLKAGLRFGNNQAKLRNLMMADPKVAAIMVKGQMDFLQSVTNGAMDNETMELYMIRNAMAMSLDPSVMENALGYIRQINDNWMHAADAASIGPVNPLEAIRAGEYLDQGTIAGFGEAVLRGKNISPKEMFNVAQVMHTNREAFGLDEFVSGSLVSLAEEAAEANISIFNVRSPMSSGGFGVSIARDVLNQAGIVPGDEYKTVSFANTGVSTKFREALATQRKQHGSISRFLTEQGSFTAMDAMGWFGGSKNLPFEQLSRVEDIMVKDEDKAQWRRLMTDIAYGGKAYRPGQRPSSYSFDLSNRAEGGGAAMADILSTLQIAASRFSDVMTESATRANELNKEAVNYE